MEDDDFTPVLEQGELPRSPGLFARFKREPPIAGAPGVTVVPIGPKGAITDDSPGQRFWSEATGYAKVDMSEHALNYRLPFSDRSGRIGMIADITITAQVLKPAEAVESGRGRSVSTIVRPVLQQALIQASADLTVDATDKDPVARYRTVVRASDGHIREQLDDDKLKRLPGWLHVKVTALHVALDEESEQHLKRLILTGRESESEDETFGLREKQTRNEIRIQAIWRDEVISKLNTSTARIWQIALTNPTGENFERAVNAINAGEFAMLHEGMQLLEALINKDLVETDGELFQSMKRFINKVEGSFLAPSELTHGEAAPELAPGDEKADAIDGTAVTEPLDGKLSDRIWHDAK